METQYFLETAHWAGQRGLKMHPHLEHKAVNGVYGIYATQNIPRFKNTDPLLKRMHAATTEYAKGERSSWKGLFNSLDPESHLRANNAFFFDDKDIHQIAAMNPILARVIQERNETTEQKIEQLLALDPSLEREQATTIVLNFKTRSWGFGFLPKFDQFNTSEAMGSRVFSSSTNIYFMTSRDYQAGEQVWI